MKYCNADIENATDPSTEIINADVVDSKQLKQTDFFIKEIVTPTQGKENRAHIDSDIRLIEARRRQSEDRTGQVITYLLFAALFLLIVFGFVVFLFRGDSSFLTVVLEQVVVLISGGVMYYRHERDKKKGE